MAPQVSQPGQHGSSWARAQQGPGTWNIAFLTAQESLMAQRTARLASGELAQRRRLTWA